MRFAVGLVVGVLYGVLPTPRVCVIQVLNVPNINFAKWFVLIFCLMLLSIANVIFTLIVQSLIILGRFVMEKAKIKSEHRWGGVLGVIGSDLVRPLSVIEGVLQEVLQEMKQYGEHLESCGINSEEDAVYRRYVDLSCNLGALHSILSGGNVILSGVICDMLEEYVMNKNCN